jgi:hypothetical protein
VEHGTKPGSFQHVVPVEQKAFQAFRAFLVPLFVPVEQGGTDACLFQGCLEQGLRPLWIATWAFWIATSWIAKWAFSIFVILCPRRINPPLSNV